MYLPYYQNIRNDVLELLPKQPFQSILEIGGGEFPTLQFLVKKYQATGWGVDIYESSVQGIKFIRGSIEEKNTQDEIPNDHFDLILANDVLEHLLDTQNALNLIYSKLKADGLVALSVPNIRQVRATYHILIKGTFPREDAGLFDRTHLRWFCRKDIVKFAEKAGFHLVDFGSSGRLVPSWLQRSALSELLALQNLFIFIKK
jgi:SAM-dependent methyltransferase